MERDKEVEQLRTPNETFLSPLHPRTVWSDCVCGTVCVYIKCIHLTSPLVLFDNNLSFLYADLWQTGVSRCAGSSPFVFLFCAVLFSLRASVVLRLSGGSLPRREEGGTWVTRALLKSLR